MAEDGQVLRHDRLAQRELLLELLYCAPTSHEDFEQANPHGMSERTEELRLEHLKLAGGSWLATRLPLLGH